MQQLDHPPLLGGATDQRSDLATGVADDPTLGLQAVDLDRPALTAQESFTNVVYAYARLGSRNRRGVEQDLVRHGELLKASRSRHRIAGQGHGAGARHLPDGRHDLPGGDADTEFHRLVPTRGVAGQGGLHFERTQAGPQRVVVVCGRDAEHGQNRIADELLERAAEMDDRLAEEHEGAIDASPDLLGVEFIDQARVADQVGEESADYAPVTGLETVGERVKSPAALVAEARAGGSRCCAVWTGHRELPGTSRILRHKEAPGEP